MLNFTLLLILGSLNLVEGTQLGFVSVSADPSLVGQTSANLYVQTSISTAIPSGGFIQITLPSLGEISISSGSLTCTITGDSTQTGNTCIASGLNIFVTTKSSISAGSTIQVNIFSALTTPTSTAETSTFTFQTLSTDKKTVLDSLSTGITLTVGSATLTSASMIQVDSNVVGATTSVIVTLVNQNKLLVGSQIKLVFPKWNSQASTSQVLPLVSNPTSVQCTKKTNVNSNITCVFDSISDTLTVSGGFPSGLAAGSTIQFVVASLRNPLSFASVSIQVSTLNSGGTGVIDQGTISFAPSTPAAILSSTASTSADVTTVQESSNFRLQFNNPVPINAGTVVTVVFPSQFSFSQLLSVVQGFGLFGSIKSLTYTADSSMSVKISSGIDSYKQANITAILTFQQVKNPSVVKATDSFSIYLTDANGFQIAQVTTGITFTPTTGTINGVFLTADQFSVNSLATLTLKFQPVHQLSSSSILQVQLPSNVVASCSGFKSSGGFSSSITCSAGTSNLFTFSNLFSSIYTYSTSTILQLGFVNVSNPGSVQSVKGYSINTFEPLIVVGGLTNFAVDSFSDSSTVLYTTTTTLFKSAIIAVNTIQTYSEATFTFTILLNNQITKGGLLVVVVPAEVSILSDMKCAGVSNLPTSLSCSLSSTSITITNGFASASAAAGTSLVFTISGLRTPLSTQTTSSFQILSEDSSARSIDQMLTSLTISMTQGRNITSMSTYSGDNTVDASTFLSISVTPSVPLQNGDKMYFTIPSDITLPSTQSLTCLGSDSFKSSLSCTINGQILVVVVSLQSSPSTANSSLMTVQISRIINPRSTKPTAEINLIVQNSAGFEIGRSVSGTGAFIVVGTPSVITNATITPLDYRQLAYTTITINLTTNNPIPVNGYLSVVFNPLYYSFTQDSTFKCTSRLVNNNQVTCSFQSDSTFLVKDLFPKDYGAGQVVDFTINNVNIGVSTKMTIPSWKVTTMTPDGYLIDRVSDGLTLTFPCNSPCQSCLTNNPNYCLTCNSLSGSTILFNNKCYSACPNGYYYNQNNQTCASCGVACKTCDPTNPNVCLSCNVNSDLYAYLLGNTCTNTCPDGYYPNKNTAQCQTCTSPCATCNSTATTCLSCNLLSNSKYQYQSSCYSTCPTGTYADANNTCQTCDSNCLTCQSSSTFCTSCKSPKYLSLYDNTCVDTCPFGQTITDNSKKQCDICDPTCLTCENKTTMCTSCSQSLNLIESTGICQGQCSNDQKTVGFNGICVACDASCLTCINNPTSCLTCANGKYMYSYTCVSTCPSGFAPDESMQCVIIGLRCPFGQEPNAAGTACVLKAQVCENGFKLNAAKDRCIPGPNYFAPFPIIISACICSLAVIVIWFKFRETLIVSNVICVFSFFETIGLLMLVSLTYEQGVYSSFALALVALVFLYGSNVFFTVVFLKQVVSADNAFKYWGLSFERTHNMSVIAGSVLNFKIYRIIYGRLMNRPQFHAAFEEPQHFFKPFTFVSVFSLVTTMLPIIISSIIGFAYIEWGYQANMSCVEMFLIELILLGLMIYEKFKLKPLVLKQHQYLKVEPKYLDNTSMNVMSSLIDENTTLKPKSLLSAYTTPAGVYNDSTTTYTYDRKSKNRSVSLATKGGNPTDNYLTMTSNAIKQEQERSKYESLEFKEYFERRRMLEKLISKIYARDATGPKTDTVDLITKMQEEEILKMQQRWCRSFRELRIQDDDFADQEAADPELQNFISAPVSPREKEMLHNPFFMGRLGEFKKAVRLRDQFDNCYAEGKPAHYFPMRDTKLISVKVQTNLLELLAIDDMIRAKTNNLIKNHDSSEEEYVEENLNEDYAQNLIDGVLNTFKEHQFTKQRRRLPRSRLQQIPNFDLTDITGEFEIDNEGNSIIIRGKDGKLNDRQGRKVNRRGYFVDNEGNIVTERGVMIFRCDELDSDEEIPAPFCFEKKKESLFKVEGLQSYNSKASAAASKNSKKKNMADQEDEIEKEYRRLREKNASHQSSVDSLMGENPSKYNKKNQRVMPGDEDGFLSKIVQPMQAKSKSQLLRQGQQQQQQQQQQQKVNMGDSENLLEGLIDTSDAKKTLKLNQSSQREGAVDSRNHSKNLQQLKTVGTESGIITRDISPSRLLNMTQSLQQQQQTYSGVNVGAHDSLSKNPQSIGGYETGLNENYDSDNRSARHQDLFFTGFTHQNQIQQNQNLTGSRMGISTGAGVSRTQGVNEGIRPNYSSSINRNQTQQLQNNSTMSLDMTNNRDREERISKINMLRETLGSTHEDMALLRQLQKFEQTMVGRQSAQEPNNSSQHKANLAKKNLQKVYGKVFDKYSLAGGAGANSSFQNYNNNNGQEQISNGTGMSFFRQPQSRPNKPPRIQSLFEEDNLKSNKKLTGTGMSILGLTGSNFGNAAVPPSDSRLKNLENIYIKSVSQERRTVSQLNKQRHQNQLMKNTQSAWDLDNGFSSGAGIPLTSQHRPLQHSMVETGIESSDYEEIKMRNQLDKMNAILNKEQQIVNSQQQNNRRGKIGVPKPNRSLASGGWI